jgi:hypothetical protein
MVSPLAVTCESWSFSVQAWQQADPEALLQLSQALKLPSFGFVAPISVEILVFSLHDIQAGSADLAWQTAVRMSLTNMRKTN